MPLPLDILSRNNDSPTHHETLAVRAEIEEVELQRERILAELAIIQAQLSHNTTRLESLRPILAPIRRVPFEILGEIFLRIPTSQLRPGNHQKSVCKLSLVCKRWRDAARLTPRLWSHIWLNAENPKLVFEAISAWTSRAGSIPKEIEISSSCCGGVQWGNFRSIRCAGLGKCFFSKDIFPKLLKQTPGTWRSLSLNCPSPDCLRIFMLSLQATGLKPWDNTGWSSLRSFEVTASKWADWTSPSVVSALSLIPESVTQIAIHLPPVARQEAVPFATFAWVAPLNIPKVTMGNLTSLKVSSVAKAVLAPSALFSTLQHCVNLKTLEVDLSGHPLLCHSVDPRAAYFIEHGLSLPKLQHLRLRQISPKSLAALKLIKSPSLLELSISFYLDSYVDRDETTPNFSKEEGDIGPSAAYDGQALADFIHGDRGSPPTLQSLHLKNLFFFDDALHHILHDLYSLSHLQLEWIGIPGNADDFHDLMNGGPQCLPLLKTMEITKLKYPIGGEIPFLREFVEERGVDLKFSLHDRVAWENDNKRYFYLTGYESESEDDD